MKKYHSVRMSVGPENLGKWSSPPQNESELSPRSIQSCVPLLQGPSCRKSPSALFRLSGSTTITVVHRLDAPFFSIRAGIVIVFDPAGSKSADGDFLQLGPWRSGKQLLIEIGENSDSIYEARKTNFQYFRGKSSRANVLNGTVSKNCKSD